MGDKLAKFLQDWDTVFAGQIAPAVAAGLATHWNRFHGPAQHVRTLELRSAHLRPAPPAAQLHEVLLATWPPRALGRGNLERLLQQQAFPSTP